MIIITVSNTTIGSIIVTTFALVIITIVIILIDRPQQEMFRAVRFCEGWGADPDHFPNAKKEGRENDQ